MKGWVRSKRVAVEAEAGTEVGDAVEAGVGTEVGDTVAVEAGVGTEVGHTVAVKAGTMAATVEAGLLTAVRLNSKM